MSVKSKLQSIAAKLLPARYYCEDALLTGHTFVKPEYFDASYQRGLRATNGRDSRNRWRVAVAIWAAKQALRSNGCFVELGVNYGFTSSAVLHNLTALNRRRRFILIDSFEGVEGKRFDSNYNHSYESVVANFKEWPHAEVYKGWLPKVLPSIPFGTIAYLHIDLNSARHEVESFQFLQSMLTKGSVVLLDDYCYSGFTKTQKAWDALGLNILALPTGQGLIIV